ncbi:MAG: hypothetical protein ACE5GJ_10010 [Gemmatimonadota bacterium]
MSQPFLAVLGLVGFLIAPPAPWGVKGHTLAARVAAEHLPGDVPAFFRAAADQLIYLDPEPDRWRSRSLTEMDRAWSFDHYIDLENVPANALQAPDRWSYLRILYEAGLEQPERDGGFLPFRIVELYERLVTEWRLWRQASPREREWIEARIVNDAGILGHYVTDAAQPHHTTIHFNGWNDKAPNPLGFTRDRSFHWRFESEFVDAHVSLGDVMNKSRADARLVAGNARAAVMNYIMESHDQVENLYRIERDVSFDPDGPPTLETVSFAAARLAAGADMLRDLWWSAWVESAQPAPEGP